MRATSWTGSLRSSCHRHPFCAPALQQPLAQRFHEFRRQYAVDNRRQVAAHGRSQVGTGPDEIVGLALDHPGAFRIEIEPPLGRLRNFECIGRIGWRAVRDRQHAHDGMFALAQNDEDDRARAILDAFLAALPRFTFPKIRITRPGRGTGQLTPASLSARGRDARRRGRAPPARSASSRLR